MQVLSPDSAVTAAEQHLEFAKSEARISECGVIMMCDMWPVKVC